VLMVGLVDVDLSYGGEPGHLARSTSTTLSGTSGVSSQVASKFTLFQSNVASESTGSTGKPSDSLKRSTIPLTAD